MFVTVRPQLGIPRQPAKQQAATMQSCLFLLALVPTNVPTVRRQKRWSSVDAQSGEIGMRSATPVRLFARESNSTGLRGRGWPEEGRCLFSDGGERQGGGAGRANVSGLEAAIVVLSLHDIDADGTREEVSQLGFSRAVLEETVSP